MAKRTLDFESPTKQKHAKTQQPEPLSPSNVTMAGTHVTVCGVVASLSPIRPSKYFDGELTDGESIIRLVGFDKNKRQELQSYSDYSIPVTLKNCLIQQNKFKGSLEIVLKSHTLIEPCQTEFNIPNPKTVGSSIIQLNQLNDFPQHSRVTIRVAVIKVNEPQTVAGGKLKQDVVVADTTAKATVTLWEPDINILKPQKSYQLNRLQIRSYQGKNQLSFPSAPSIDEIEEIEDTIETFTSSDEENEEQQLEAVTVSGIRQLETLYVCINCNKSITPMNSYIGECESCHTTQKLSNAKQTAKLLFETATKKLTLRAHDNILKIISGTETSQKEISAQDLLYSPPFDCTYNKYNTITKISRK